MPLSHKAEILIYMTDCAADLVIVTVTVNLCARPHSLISPPFFSLLPQVCRTKEKRNITQRRWSTYKIYKVLHQNQLPRFMRTLICCCSALLFKAPWQCDCPFFFFSPLLVAAVSCVLCYTKSPKFIKRRGGCKEETAPQREIKDGDEERTEIDREEESREERAALLSNSPAKINPPREKQNILWNKTLASPSKNAATFIYYSQVSDKCLEEMEKLSLQLCFSLPKLCMCPLPHRYAAQQEEHAHTWELQLGRSSQSVYVWPCAGLTGCL